MASSVAFAVSCTWTGISLLSRDLPLPSRRRKHFCTKPVTRASITEDDSSETKEKPNKTLEIAEMLGQSKESMEEKQQEVFQTARLSKREKYSLALASTAVAVGIFLFQKFSPDGSANLLRYLQQSSLPVSIVGTNNRPSIVEFSAGWCESCKSMARDIFDLENQYSGRINFVVIDGENPQNQDIIDQFGVDGIPQFSLINKKGEVQGNLIGFTPKEVLARDLDALIKEETLPFPGVALRELLQPEY